MIEVDPNHILEHTSVSPGQNGVDPAMDRWLVDQLRPIASGEDPDRNINWEHFPKPAFIRRNISPKAAPAVPVNKGQ